MVNVEFPTPYPNETYPPYIPNEFPLTWSDNKIKERHVKKARKGLLIEYTDGSYSFIATDDECYAKIKKALNDDS